MPKYMAVIAIILTIILFVPEAVWAFLGVDAIQQVHGYPKFVQYYVSSTSFKNAMLVFWVTSPFALAISSGLSIFHINHDFNKYLNRREEKLKKSGKASDFNLVVGVFVFVCAYIWGTAIYLNEPTIFGGISPTKTRATMALIHAGSIAFLIPIMFAVLIAEVRAIISTLHIAKKEEK